MAPLEIGASNQYALVGEPKRRYLWILSRSPKINTELLESLKEIAVDLGTILAQETASVSIVGDKYFPIG